MFKKILTFIMLIFILIGLGTGLYFATFSKNKDKEKQEIKQAIFEKMQTKQVEVTEIFTYGKCFNFSGKLAGVSKDNFESAKLYLTDGNEFKNVSIRC